MKVHAILAQGEQEIIDEAFAALQRPHSGHYEAAGEQFTRQRLADLFELAVAAIRDQEVSDIVRYAEQIASERFYAGFDISELQTAFNLLEEAMWRRLVATEPPVDLNDAVARLSTVLGAGKDALARAYVSLASHRHVPSLDLSALSQGTGA